MMSIPTSLTPLIRSFLVDLRLRRETRPGGWGSLRPAEPGLARFHSWSISGCAGRRAPAGGARSARRSRASLAFIPGPSPAAPGDAPRRVGLAPPGGAGPRSLSFHRHRLREVAGLIDVVPAAIRDVVGEELQRHDRESG